jgi:EmrB/QacA subfamily drug resistance transporter
MTTADTPAGAPLRSAPPPAPLFTHRQILIILSGLLLGMFLASLDQTIVTTSIRTIADDLNGFSLQAWATTAYLVTSTLTTPLYGKLSDLYGRKPLYLVAIGIFLVGSILCGFSTSMYELAVFRAVQGLGAGGLQSLALTIIGDIVAPRERARYQAYILGTFAISSVIGPLIGGLLAGQSTILGIDGWRWVFLVNVPVGALALFVVWRVLNLPHSRRHAARIDWAGTATLTWTLVPLLIVAEQGRIWGWWSGRTVLLGVIGLIGLAAYVYAEARMREHALIPLRFYRNRTFSLCVGLFVVQGAALFGPIALLPQYLQVVKDMSPTRAGLHTLPLVLSLMLTSLVVGRLIRRTGHYGYFPPLGTVIATASMFLFATVSVDTSVWQLSVYMVVYGIGIGNMTQPLILAVQSALPPSEIGVTTAAGTFYRQIGGSIGVAVFLSLLFSRMTGEIADALRGAAGDPAFSTAAARAAGSDDSAVRAIGEGLTSGDTGVGSKALDDTSFIHRLDPVLARPFKEGFAHAFDTTFVVIGCVMLVAVVLVAFFREIPLRETSAMEARRADSAAAAGH